MTDRVKIRQAAPGDLHFILSTWLKSFKHSSYFAKRIRNSIFFSFHHKIVTRILDMECTKALVACDPVDPNVIYGYLVMGEVAGEDVVHYVYIKSAFRQMGIAKMLAKSAHLNLDKFSFTHWTYSTDWLVEKLPGGTYVPYLV